VNSISQQERSSAMQVVVPSNSRSLIVSSTYLYKAMSKVVSLCATGREVEIVVRELL